MSNFSLARRAALSQIALMMGSVLVPGRVGAATTLEGRYLTFKSAFLSQSAEKIEVVEFFAYTCPHCFRLETVIGPWSRHLPTGVVFQRIPVVFQESARPLART